MKILFDIDGTVCRARNFVGVSCRIGKMLRLPIFKNVQIQKGIIQFPRDEDLGFWKTVNKVWYLFSILNLSMPLYPGTKKFFQKLQNDNIDVVFYTMRPENTFRYTQNYLRKLIANPTVYFAAQNRKNCFLELSSGKLEIINKIQPDIVIEDDEAMVRRAIQAGCQNVFIILKHNDSRVSYTFSMESETEKKNCYVATNWQQVASIIKKIKPSLKPN